MAQGVVNHVFFVVFQAILKQILNSVLFLCLSFLSVLFFALFPPMLDTKQQKSDQQGCNEKGYGTIHGGQIPD